MLLVFSDRFTGTRHKTCQSWNNSTNPLTYGRFFRRLKAAQLLQQIEELAKVRLPEQQHHGYLVAVGLRQVGGGRRPVVLPQLSTGTQRHKHQLQETGSKVKETHRVKGQETHTSPFCTLLQDIALCRDPSTRHLDG